MRTPPVEIGVDTLVELVDVEASFADGEAWFMSPTDIDREQRRIRAHPPNPVLRRLAGEGARPEWRGRSVTPGDGAGVQVGGGEGEN